MEKKNRISDYITQYSRVYFWNTVRKFGLISQDYTIKDQEKDRIAPFDEYLPCEMCGSNSVEEVLITKDQSRIVECSDCGLQYTSPRINEETGMEYLKMETPRSIEFTENRVKYGRVLSSNIKFVPPTGMRKG